MASSLSAEHPKQVLLFFVDQDIDDNIRAKTISFVEQLGSVRDWVIGVPTAVDSMVKAENLALDTPVATIGGYIELYSASSGISLPADIDMQHLEEVEYLIERLRVYSRVNRLAIGVELDGDSVGSIEDGVLDNMLKEVFLGEWRKHLEQPS